MKLPRTVQVGSKRYSVEVVEAMREKRLGAKVNYMDHTITIGRTSGEDGRRFTPGELNEAFWHETTHAILDDMDHPLRNNEAFVTAFARRLARAILSARTDE